MSGAGALAVLAVTISALVQVCTDPRITRKFILKSLLAVAVYLIHGLAGVLVVIYLLPYRPEDAGEVTVGILGWIGLGMLGLIRFSPRLQEPPKWLMHFGVPDVICLLMIVFGVASAFGVFR